MKKPVLAFIAAVALVVATFTCFGDPIFGQETKTPVSAVGEQSTEVSKSLTAQVPAPDNIKPLTTEEKATLENKVIKMELLARELSPEALGKAIADLIAAKQQAYQAATQDLNTYTTSIQIEGTVLNRDPKTGEFSRVKK